MIPKRIPQAHAGGSPQGRPASNPARRDAIRRGVQKALREAEAMLAAVGEGELTRLSNKAFELRDTLQDLWAMRDEREDDWGDLLNLLQIALEMDEYESLTAIQCKAREGGHCRSPLGPYRGHRRHRRLRETASASRSRSVRFDVSCRCCTGEPRFFR